MSVRVLNPASLKLPQPDAIQRDVLELRICLSLRDLEEPTAERGLSLDHASSWRWIQAHGPEVYQRLQGEVKRKSSTWHVDETCVRISNKWMDLFRAVDSHGQTVDFYLPKRGTAKPPSCS